VLTDYEYNNPVHFLFVAIYGSSGNLVKEIKTQSQKATRVAGCLNNFVWRNKYMRKETK
jgi:hypothetical protein